MEQNKLTQKINNNPSLYIQIGLTVFVLGIVANMFTSAFIKPLLIETMGDSSVYIGFPLSIVTAFMALMGFVIFTTALNAKKEAKQSKIVKRNKKRK